MTMIVIVLLPFYGGDILPLSGREAPIPSCPYDPPPATPASRLEPGSSVHHIEQTLKRLGCNIGAHHHPAAIAQYDLDRTG
jgi:hypothetical protein